MDVTDLIMPSVTIRPSRRMLAYLKGYDSKLDAFLNVVNDRWTIVRYVPMLKYEGTWRGISWTRVVDVPWPVLALQDQDGGYMRFDERALWLIWESDLHRVHDLDRHLSRLDQKMIDTKRKMESDFRDDIRHATLENKHQLAKAFAPFDRGTDGPATPRPMSHDPVEVSWDEMTF